MPTFFIFFWNGASFHFSSQGEKIENASKKQHPNSELRMQSNINNKNIISHHDARRDAHCDNKRLIYFEFQSKSWPTRHLSCVWQLICITRRSAFLEVCMKVMEVSSETFSPLLKTWNFNTLHDDTQYCFTCFSWGIVWHDWDNWFFLSSLITPVICHCHAPLQQEVTHHHKARQRDTNHLSITRTNPYGRFRRRKESSVAQSCYLCGEQQAYWWRLDDRPRDRQRPLCCCGGGWWVSIIVTQLHPVTISGRSQMWPRPVIYSIIYSTSAFFFFLVRRIQNTTLPPLFKVCILFYFSGNPAWPNMG